MRVVLRALRVFVGLMVLALTVMRGEAFASPITMTFDFAGGFNLSVNGEAAAPSGPLTFLLGLDNTTPDLDASATRGRFALTSIVLTAPSLGFTNTAVIAPSPMFVDTFSGGMTIIGSGFNPDIGWNGGPGPSTFMGNINDLTTLPLPTVITMNSTFFLGTITLAGGTTLTGTTGGSGPRGTFSAAAATAVPVPEAASVMALWAAGIGLLAFKRFVV